MIVSPHKGQGLDGTVVRICEHIDSPIPIVPITRVNDFKFNEELRSLKEYILADYIEYDWNWDLEKSGTHLFGKNTKDFHHFDTDEWRKFDEWVGNNKPHIYFKRELLSADATDNVAAIDYPCWLPEIPVQTKEQFNDRLLSVFYFWGRSHEQRLILHSDIWRNASYRGYSVCDNFFYFNNFIKEEKGEKWASMWMPHYCRVDISEVMKINGAAKISIAMPGAGRKTFRATGESPVNAVLMMKEDNLAYSYQWLHNQNCIKFQNFGEEISTIMEALNNPLLYEIYLESVENCNKYRIARYVKNYLMPIINKA